MRRDDEIMKDSFAALDFGDEPGDESGHDRSAALDFGDEPGYQTSDEWGFDAVPADEPAEPAVSGIEPRAIDTLPEDTGDTADTVAEEDEFSWERTTVTNPPETVSVTALMDGKTLRIDLAADAAGMTESELAAEILVIADVASQKASSVLHTLLLGSMQAQGLEDDGALAELLGARFLGLTSATRAAETQAEVFTTRYQLSAP
ncbi:ESX-1 secretion-associated protein EspH [Mycobacterium lentiflavum]|uniref:ESX-1 secretion-associated protein EspH n=2 Tax=Mycobacterium lentiflavum TaxID=141349 RepID=A0A0E4GW05_MYCLN|nr:ESX-1 secretion-associated protein EspH [Mycobacterium lentiflavum]